jgi:hypothetical protein
MPQEPTVVRHSFIRGAGVFLLGLCGMAVGLFLVVGWNMLFTAIFGGLLALFFALGLLAIARDRPRVVITDDGFTFLTAFGDQVYHWADVDGEFAVAPVGILKLVAFRLTPEYKAAHKVGRPPVPGYDAAIGGTFRMPMAALADLLNRRKKAAGGMANDQ